MACRLRGEGVLNRRRRPVTRQDVDRALQRLGLQSHTALEHERLVALLRQHARTSTVGELVQRANALGLRTRRGTPWTCDAMYAMLASLGLRSARKRHVYVRNAAGRFTSNERRTR
jgi:hypothetical protein